MLKFVGVGSAFNTAYGNTAAFLYCGKDKILFDCGENIFTRLKDSDFWTGNIHVFTTHNHPDHVGSLGSLIFYAYFIHKAKVTVYGDDMLKTILKLNGVYDEMYEFKSFGDGTKLNEVMTIGEGNEKFLVYPVLTSHAKNMPSRGFIIRSEVRNQTVWFSGDAKEIPSFVMDKFNEGKITTIYQDTSWIDYPDNVHLSYKKLCEIFKTKRDKVFIMHMDENFNIDKAKADGFKIAGME